MARIGLEQAGDDVDQGRLATAGPAEQRKHSSTFHFDRYVESESIAARLSANLQHQRPSILYMRRAMSSAATRPSSPSVIEMAASRAARASPPGVCNAV